jgi:hypothetical protein
MKVALLGLFVGLVGVVAGCSTSAPVAKATPRESSSPTSLAAPSPLASPSPSPNPSPMPTLSPLPSPIAVPDSPAPIGIGVAARVLPPANVLPAGSLCSAAIQLYQDGNAGPLFCRGGAIIVEAWTHFASTDPQVLSVGRGATLTAVESAICADGLINHATYPIEQSVYQLAAAYYGWNFAFDIVQFQQHGTCP